MRTVLLKILFCFFVTFISSAQASEVDSTQISLDYQLYTNSLGNEYSRVHFPVDENQTVIV